MIREKRKDIIRDFEMAIIHLNKIFQDYWEMKGHSKILVVLLFRLLRTLSNDLFKLRGDEAEDEDEDEMAFHSAGKKVILN